jgi:hypothetical protein
MLMGTPKTQRIASALTENWLRSQYFSNNEGFMEGVKIWLSSKGQTSLMQVHKNIFPDMISASVS